MNHLGASGTRYAITDTLPTQGFTGISVALIASSNPIGIIFSGILIAFFQVGGVSMQSLGLEPQLVSVITSVIIYFCAFNFVIKALYMKLIKRMISKNKGEGEMI
jgi:simple sugar transport system permease protein